MKNGCQVLIRDKDYGSITFQCFLVFLYTCFLLIHSKKFNCAENFPRKTSNNYRCCVKDTKRWLNLQPHSTFSNNNIKENCGQFPIRTYPMKTDFRGAHFSVELKLNFHAASKYSFASDLAFWTNAKLDLKSYL